MNFKIRAIGIKNLIKYTPKIKRGVSISSNEVFISKSSLPFVTIPMVAYIVSPHAQNKLKENLIKESVKKKRK